MSKLCAPTTQPSQLPGNTSKLVQQPSMSTASEFNQHRFCAQSQHPDKGACFLCTNHGHQSLQTTSRPQMPQSAAMYPRCSQVSIVEPSRSQLTSNEYIVGFLSTLLMSNCSWIWPASRQQRNSLFRFHKPRAHPPPGSRTGVTF